MEKIGLKEIEDMINDIEPYDYSASTEKIMEKIEQAIDKAREEGFDDGVERTVDIIQKGLDELLLEKGEEKYWVGDILRDCGYSVEKILPKNMKHYKSKLRQ